MTIPFIDFSSAGEELVFMHANGYPPDCYRPLLSRLAETYHVTAMAQRPLTFCGFSMNSNRASATSHVDHPLNMKV
jgi:hypothetical protein